MEIDYRCTEFCEPIENVKAKKETVEALVKEDHPEAKDMHTYISKKDSLYKAKFIEAYSGKCAYCGASIRILPKTAFEIDHFIYKEDPRFGKSKAKAGYIDNLVLACYKCNRAKSALSIPDASHEYLHPDYQGIKSTFIRDDVFNIKISPEKENNAIVKEFYQKLELEAQVHRLDFLLLNMCGLREKIDEKSPAYGQLIDAIELLRTKRNIMG